MRVRVVAVGMGVGVRVRGADGTEEGIVDERSVVGRGKGVKRASEESEKGSGESSVEAFEVLEKEGEGARKRVKIGK
jgi:hypothetical protein